MVFSRRRGLRRVPGRAPDRAPGLAGPPPVELPAVNMLVRLVPPAADEAFASRVEDVAAPGAGEPWRFLVAAPMYPGDLLDSVSDDVPEGLPGDEGWTLTWVTGNSGWELPVRRSAASRADGGRVRSWWLTPAGPVRRNQRRQFFRVDCQLPVRLDQLCEPFATLSGYAIDLSEGGMRCLLPLWESEAGSRVLVHLSLDGLPGPVEGVVLRSHRRARTQRVPGWKEVVVAFDGPQRYADAIRRTLVGMQVHSRRLTPATFR